MASNFGFPAYGGDQRKVFISYKKSDESRVAPIAAELARIGIPVWYDQAGGEGIALGSLWQQTISENMMLSSVVLAFISKATFTIDGYMLTELSMAKNMNLPIIPIYIDPPMMIQAAMPVAYTAQWTQLNQYQCFDITAMGPQQAIMSIASAANFYMQNDGRNIPALKAKIESEHKNAGIVSDPSGNLSHISTAGRSSGSRTPTGKAFLYVVGLLALMMLIVLFGKFVLFDDNSGADTGNDSGSSYSEELQTEQENGNPDSENNNIPPDTDSVDYAAPENKACVYLGKDISAYNHGYYYDEYDGTSTFKLGGVEYRHGFTIGTYTDNGIANFNLDGKYTYFAGVAGNVDGVNYSVTYNVLGDGELIGTIDIEGGCLPVPFEFNVSGVKQLCIAATGQSSNYEGVGFGNAVLYNNASDKPVLYESNKLPDTAYLGSDIHAYYNGYYYDEYNNMGSPFKLGGVEYRRGFTIGTYTGNGIANFNLDGKYTYFAGVAGNVDRVNYSVSYNVLGDGELIGTIDIEGGCLPVPFEFNVSGVKQLCIAATGQSSNYEGVGFGNPVLYNDASDKPAVYESAKLSDTAYLGSDIKAYVHGYYYEEYNGTSTFSLAGNTYLKGFTIGTYRDNGYAKFNIDGKYTTFSGVAGNVDGVNYSVVYAVLGDGNPIGTIEVVGGGLPTEFRFDVTGIKQLDIVSTGNSSNRDGVGFGNAVRE